MFKGISKIIGNNVEFECGNDCEFDAIVFATGYKSTTNLWLKVHTSVCLNCEGCLNPELKFRGVTSGVTSSVRIVIIKEITEVLSNP